jgi:hypothetical protein
MIGIIYLLQPVEFIGTNIYKIGQSPHMDLGRIINSYGRGTLYISIHTCKNPHVLENIIKDFFRNKYKLYMRKGYIEGDGKTMFKDFIKLVDEYKDMYIMNPVKRFDNYEQCNDQIINLLRQWLILLI